MHLIITETLLPEFKLELMLRNNVWGFFIGVNSFKVRNQVRKLKNTLKPTADLLEFW